uniref:Uncharacterized protein n=1 Tax=Anguilla anguilla TaxID=7936 RepID=A0A0E9XGF2_ANGAN
MTSTTTPFLVPRLPAPTSHLRPALHLSVANSLEIPLPDFYLMKDINPGRY